MRPVASVSAMFRWLLAAFTIVCLLVVPAIAQEQSTAPAESPAWAGDSLVEMPVDELSIRLTALDLATLELIRVDVMDRVRANANALAAAIVDRI